MGVQEIRTATRAGVLADDRTGVGVETLRRAIQEYLFYRCGNVPALATRSDYYLAVAYTVRDRLMQRWLSTARSLLAHPTRVVQIDETKPLIERFPTRHDIE